MLKTKELGHILIATVILIFVVNFHLLVSEKNIPDLFLTNTISIALVLATSLLAKKLTAYYYECKIEHKIWSGNRYGFKPNQHFKTPIPYGIVVPFITTFISYGYFLWMSILEFEIKPLPQKSSKRHGIYRYSEITDTTIGIIAASGVIINLILSIIGYIVGFTIFARFSIYFAFFSMIPFGNLDGTKILFGSTTGRSGTKPILWIILLTICVIFLVFGLMTL